MLHKAFKWLATNTAKTKDLKKIIKSERFIVFCRVPYTLILNNVK